MRAATAANYLERPERVTASGSPGRRTCTLLGPCQAAPGAGRWLLPSHPGWVTPPALPFSHPSPLSPPFPSFPHPVPAAWDAGSCWLFLRIPAPCFQSPDPWERLSRRGSCASQRPPPAGSLTSTPPPPPHTLDGEMTFDDDVCVCVSVSVSAPVHRWVGGGYCA